MAKNKTETPKASATGRINTEQVEAITATLNEITGSPATAYSEQDGAQVPNAGHFRAASRKGGVVMERIGEGGVITTPFGSSPVPRASLYARVQAFMDGITFARENA